MSERRPALRDAAQPSLWDRLVDDLPGLMSEIAGLRHALEARLGAEPVARALEAGNADAAGEIADEPRRALTRLVHLERRRRILGERTIVVSAEVLREAVRRDIEALFNTERFEADLLLTPLEETEAQDDPAALDDFPHVRRSVVNYGVPAFSGRTRRDFDRDALARDLREVLIAFEPRLRRDTVRVTVGSSEREGMRIEIEGLLLTAPVPERLSLRTLIDLDNGRATTALGDA